MRRECQECFPRHRLQMKPRVSDPDMHHGTCVPHVPSCMSGLLAMHVGIANPWRRGKRSRHSRRMQNPQFYVSGKRLITLLLAVSGVTPMRQTKSFRLSGPWQQLDIHDWRGRENSQNGHNDRGRKFTKTWTMLHIGQRVKNIDLINSYKVSFNCAWKL